jgi:hypothetical protein
VTPCRHPSRERAGYGWHCGYGPVVLSQPARAGLRGPLLPLSRLPVRPALLEQTTPGRHLPNGPSLLPRGPGSRGCRFCLRLPSPAAVASRDTLPLCGNQKPVPYGGARHASRVAWLERDRRSIPRNAPDLAVAALLKLATAHDFSAGAVGLQPPRRQCLPTARRKVPS